MSEDSNLLELARGEDVNAIETILNQQLEAKNITAKVVLKDSCLQIMLISKQVPDQQFMAVFICKKITNLGIKSIERLKIYGKQTGDEFPAWSQEFELAGKQQTLSSSTVNNLANHNFSKALYTIPSNESQKKPSNKTNVSNLKTNNIISYDIPIWFT